jgi:hypothetical protein
MLLILHGMNLKCGKKYTNGYIGTMGALLLMNLLPKR